MHPYLLAGEQIELLRRRRLLRGDGRKVSPEEATALLRVLRGPAHCQKCGYFGPYGKHADGGFLDAECTSFASYDND